MDFIDRIKFWIYRQEERSKYFAIQDRINAKKRKEEYEKEFMEWKFAKLRADIYPIVHSKQRSLDELIYLWDFFREHMVVVDLRIRQADYKMSKYKDVKNREKMLKTVVKMFGEKREKCVGSVLRK